MLQTFLLFDTITNEKTVKFMQRDIITSTITWHLGLVGSNNFGISILPLYSPFTLVGSTCAKDALQNVCLALFYAHVNSQGNYHVLNFCAILGMHSTSQDRF